MSQSLDSRAKEAFLEALERPTSERHEFLAALRASEPELADRVADLLRAHGGRAAAELDRAPQRLGSELRAAVRAPGQRIGDYELLEEVGEGAFGSVWRARQLSLERVVALKLLRSGRLADARDHARLRAEAEAVARLDHPHIVPVYDVGDSDGISYFSMKWIEGGPLASRLQQPWPLRRAVLLMVDIARAVHHAHQRGLLHRDLKPSNVLLDAQGDPHVADFGVAKRLDEADAATTRTLVGTPAYMAPEQADGGELTVATDVWALGCILYELLAGRAAFRADTIADTLRKVRQESPEPLRKLRSDTPRDLETIVLVCLRKEPSRRYSSASALADDLERWLAHEPIAARRTNALERLTLFCRRSPLAATLIGLVAALLVLLASVATWASIELSKRLRESYIGEARAIRLAGQPGARVASLALLQRAAAIRRGDDLLDATIASLALSDIELERAVPRVVGAGVRTWADPQLERVVSLVERRAIVAELASARVLAEYELPREGVSARWSRDGSKLLVVLAPEATGPSALVFDVSNPGDGLPLSAPLGTRNFDFRDGADELAFVTPSSQLVLLSLTTRDERLRLDVGPHADGLRFRAGGEEFALLRGGELNTVEFRSADDARVLREVSVGAWPVQITWLASEAGFALACGDSKIRVYDEHGVEPRLVLAGHSAEVVDLVASPNAPLLLSYAWDETTRLWDARSGRELTRLSARFLGFDATGARLAAMDTSALNLWRVWHGDVLVSARAHVGKSPVALTFADDNATVASAGADGLWIWNSAAADVPRRVFEGDLRSAAFVEGTSVLAASGPDGLWRVDLGSSEAPRRMMEGPLWIVARAADAELLAVNGSETVHVLDSRTWSPRAELRGAPGLEHFALSRDGARLAAGCWRGSGVHVWDLDSPATPRHWLKELSHVAAAVSPDGEMVATTSGQSFELWRAGDGARLVSIDRERSFGATPGPVAFRPDGAQLAFGLSTTTVRLVDVDELRKWGDLTLPTSEAIVALAYSPDGSRLAAACSTNSIHVWNLAELARRLDK